MTTNRFSALANLIEYDTNETEQYVNVVPTVNKPETKKLETKMEIIIPTITDDNSDGWRLSKKELKSRKSKQRQKENRKKARARRRYEKYLESQRVAEADRKALEADRKALESEIPNVRVDTTSLTDDWGSTTNFSEGTGSLYDGLDVIVCDNVIIDSLPKSGDL